VSDRPRVGLAYRREISAEIGDLRDELDCLEILVEHFIPLTPERRRELEGLRADFDLIPHGVGLSPGSVRPAPDAYYAQVAEVVAVIEAPFFGEHASLSRGGGFDIRHLSPLWRTHDGLEALVANLDRASDRIGVPIALETITETHVLAGAELDWDEFYVEAARRAGAGLLVDVTNVWVNRENGIVVNRPSLFGALGGAPWHQFHLAGTTRDGDGFYLDSHDAPLSETVLGAYREALAIQTAPVTIIERDARLSAVEELVTDLRCARAALGQALSAPPV
jgi:uncharacterized protein (UPF0276 family)